MNEKKVCLVGAFAVGKTSLIKRFVDGIFSDKYLTTVGVKIDSKTLEVENERLQLLLWDIQGEDELSTVPLVYLKGAAAIIYVVDGTRIDTLTTALNLKHDIERHYDRSIPSLLLLNKSDLTESWEIDAATMTELESGGILTQVTSSKLGHGVDEAFDLVCRMLLGKTGLAA